MKTKVLSMLIGILLILTSCTTSGGLMEFESNETRTRFPTAVKAEVLYMTAPVSDISENLLLASLQGLAAKSSTEQILITVGSVSYFQPYLENEFNVELKNTVNEQQITVRSLAEYYKNMIDGYILCAKDNESANVAISLAGIMNCVIATPDTEAMLEGLGYECLLDVSEKDDDWLRDSEYWQEINRDIAVEQPYTSAPRLVDYAILCNAYFNFYNGTDESTHSKMFEFLNDNAIVIGWNNTLGEFSTVQSLSRLNAQLIPADHASNLSTLSGFNLESLTQKTVNSADTEIKDKHTVCIIMSDGDNLQWSLNDYPTNPKWFGSELRGSFKMGWGVAPSAIDLIAPTALYFYDNMTENDEFITQLSGLGYTFPSLWDDVMRREMASQLAECMERNDTRFAEILDDDGFYTSILDDFTAQKNIDGLFYIGYSDYYSGHNGKVLWSNGKPVVSARYSLWNNKRDGEGEIDYIADKINNASTDVTSTEAYSFIIVHSWSGFVDGKLVPDGNTMEAIAALVSKLGENADVVTPSEFMDRIIKNCKPE